MDQFIEPHIVVGFDRIVTVPPSLKRIAVQYDHAIETVTFDCPRIWDGHDFLDQAHYTIYINLMLPDSTLIADPVTNVVGDDTDPTIMHFDWTVKNYITQEPGRITFAISIKQIDENGFTVRNWHTEPCSDMCISKGLECYDTEEDLTPDLVTKVLKALEEFESGDYAIIRDRIDMLEAKCEGQGEEILQNKNNLSTEISTRQTADTNLDTRISNEQRDRIAADEALNARVDSAQDEAVAEVEAKIAALEVGGRNLLINSAGPFTTTAEHRGDFNPTGGGYFISSTYKHGVILEPETAYTMSFNYKITWGECMPISPCVYIGYSESIGGEMHTWTHIAQYENKNHGTMAGSNTYPVSGKIHYSFTTPSASYLSTYKYFTVMPYANTAELPLTGSQITISNVKLEKGTFATSWTPNPAEFAPTNTTKIEGYRSEYNPGNGASYNYAKYVHGFATRYVDGRFRIYGTLSILYGNYPVVTDTRYYVDYLLRRDEIATMAFGDSSKQFKRITGFWQGISDVSHGDCGQFSYITGKGTLASDKVLKFTQGGTGATINVHEMAKNFSLYFDICGEVDD